MQRLGAIAILTIIVVFCLFAQRTYNERYRPQYHFSPRTNWTNDPCGLVYALGKYNLFFQHNPFANAWGHMSWGHAASTDLLHWNELPVAISEDKRAAIFTGSSVFDEKNTSGLCRSSERGCIVSVYTGFTPKTAASPEKQTQNLALSQDGLTWTKYSGNPVLDLGRSDTRDPKVFWFEPEKKWVMVIVQADDKKVRLFSSQNLREWHPLSEFGPKGATGGVWECPDLYMLPVNGPGGEMRWILKIGLNPGGVAGGSGEQYFIGHFDGTTFTADDPNGTIHWLDYGRDCYCGLTFNNEPNPQVPRMIGWMDNWQYAADVPTSPWRGQMTLPRELRLESVNGLLTLLQQPIQQLQSLRLDNFQYSGSNIGALNTRLASWPHRSQAFEVDTILDTGSAREIELNVLEGGDDQTVVGFDGDAAHLFVDRTKSGATQFSKAFPSRTVAPLLLHGSRLKLHIFVDRSSVEVFAQDGAVTITNLVFPKAESNGISLTASGGHIKSIEFRMWNLASVWNKM